MKAKIFYALMVAMLFSISCKKADEIDQLPVEVAIVSFTASPAEIVLGKSSTLSWEATGATAVSIDQGIGTVPAVGSVQISPSSSAIYTLTAGSRSASVSIAVVQPGPAGHAIITRFTVSDNSMPVYKPVTAAWEVQKAVSVTLNGRRVNAAGSDTRTYSQSEKLVLEARGEDGQLVRAELRITVDTRSACTWIKTATMGWTFTDMRTCEVETAVNGSPYYSARNVAVRCIIRDHATNEIIDTAMGSIPIVVPGARGVVILKFSIGKKDWSDNAAVDIVSIDCGLTL